MRRVNLGAGAPKKMRGGGMVKKGMVKKTGVKKFKRGGEINGSGSNLASDAITVGLIYGAYKYGIAKGKEDSNVDIGAGKSPKKAKGKKA